MGDTRDSEPTPKTARPPGELLESTAEFYDRLAYDYDRLFSYSGVTTRVQTTWLNLKLKKGRVLDLGCGTGRMISPLTEKGYEVIGLDCAGRMLSQARRRWPRANLVQADACQALPFADASFDNVISLHASIIHATGWQDLMTMSREVLRVLRPRGRFVIEMPHPSTYPDESAPTGWTDFQPGVRCRVHSSRVREVQLTQLDGLRTKVRLFDSDDAQAWLQGFSKLAFYENYTHLPLDFAQGEVMLILAEK